MPEFRHLFEVDQARARDLVFVQIERRQFLEPLQVLQAIVDQGGVVAAPYHDPANQVLPWALCLGGTDESDLRVADEVLRETVIGPRRRRAAA